MDQDLCVAFDSFIKLFRVSLSVLRRVSCTLLDIAYLFIGHLGISNVDLVGDHETRLGLARDNEITQVSVVLLDVALSCGETQSLKEKSAYQDPVTVHVFTHLLE